MRLLLHCRTLVVSTVLLAACRQPPPTPPTPVANAIGGLVLRPCTLLDTIPAECGSLTVFERRDQKQTRLIAVPVLRVRATAPTAQPPVVWLSGGPGATNMLRPPPAFLHASHDWILVGYRGIDGSEQLECPEVTAAQRAVDDDLLGPVMRRAMGIAFRDCATRLTREGIDINAFSIEEVVGDIDEARAALGYDRVHLFSASYGTRIAQRYAERFPSRVARSVQRGVNPPGRFAWDAEALDSVLVAWSALCRADAWCSARTPDLAAVIRRVAHKMPTRWGPLSIDRGAVLVAGFGMLYSTSSAPLYFRAMLDADRGDASGLALISLASRRLLARQEHLGDMYSKGMVDFDPSRDYANELQLDASIMGAPLSAYLWGPMADSTSWPTVSTRPVSPPTSDVETLLLSGDLDVATPARYAEQELLPRLTRGHHVVVRHAGHSDIASSQGDGHDRLVGGFFARGVVDTTGLRVAPVRFDRGPSLSRLTKTAAAVGSGLVAVLVGGVIWLVR
jgi:pimeloyl-ACP methyl ester carboxylesterase